jgi:threonine dehydrogenase-like Zn-dependent dehydrogenase
LVVRRQPPALFPDSTIVVKLLAAGVCGTDLAILSGARAGQATVLGHEAVGVVHSSPAGSALSRGASVIVNPVHGCSPGSVIGHSQDGVFREWFCMDASEVEAGQFLVSCPGSPFHDLVLAEPLASVLYAIELLQENGSRGMLLVRGSGTVGVLAARMWPRITGSPAIVVSSSRQHAAWLSASIRWPSNVAVGCASELPALVAGRTVDAGILCCSRQDAAEGLALLFASIRSGATIDLMAGFPPGHNQDRIYGLDLDAVRSSHICGVRQGPPVLVNAPAGGKSVFLIGHRGTSHRHILQAVALLSDGAVSLDDLPHRLLGLQELPDAVCRMLSAEQRHATHWIKAVVSFNGEGRQQPGARP